MKYENVQVNEKMLIDSDSELIYSSSVGVGSDDEEVRLILFNKRLVSDGENMEIVNDSDMQIILNKSTALKLRDLLNEHLNE